MELDPCSATSSRRSSAFVAFMGQIWPDKDNEFSVTLVTSPL